ncbi:MAG: acyltransferase [Fimbriimonadaceae bacterium]
MNLPGQIQGTEDLPKRKLAYIDGMRGVAALYVVVSHLCNMVDPNARLGKPTNSPEWLQTLMSPFWYGHLAVASFIVISGFCLQMSLFERGNGSIKDFLGFFSRRARRILPAYYAALGVSILVALTITQSQSFDARFAQYLPVDQATVVSHLLLIHNLDPGMMYKINGALWSIAIEVQLYILFPILCIGLVRVGRLIWLGILSLAVALILPSVPIKLYLWYIPLFVLGMALAHMAYRPAPKLGTKPAWFVAIGLASLISTYFVLDADWFTPIADAFIGIATACFLYVGLVAPWSWTTRLFSLRFLAGVGIFSYSLYVMHHPIQQMMWVVRPAWADGPANELMYMILIALPFMLFFSYLFYRAFERPFMTVRRRRAEAQEETRIMQGQSVSATPAAIAAPVYADKSAYGIGRRRRPAA